MVAYYAAAHFGYAFEFSGPVAAIVWLPVGVGIAFLYLGGLQLWPGVVVGDLLVNNYSTLPAGSALAQSLGNLLEVLLATVLLLRLCPRDKPLGTLPGVMGMVAAVACATLLSATIGSLASWLGGVVGTHKVLYVWRTWWLGDLSGALILVPLVLTFSSLPARPWRRARVLEGGLAVAVVAALSAVQLDRTMLLCALVFPGLIWVAVRLGSRGAALATAIICGFAVWGATNDLGPFGVGSINMRLFETQLFIATVSLCALAIAALVSEREELAGGLRASRARLVAASDEARQQVERDLHDGAQQSLIAVQVELGHAAEVIAADPSEGQRLVSLVERRIDEALAGLRALSQGVYPPVLRDRGLLDALRSAARLIPSDVAVQGIGVGRYSQPVEAAVYFCCLEALQNVAKHAGPASHTDVRLWEQGEKLRFEVVDSGVGFDADSNLEGSGFANMRDRIEAVGGTLTVSSHIGSGTAVEGRVPAT